MSSSADSGTSWPPPHPACPPLAVTGGHETPQGAGKGDALFVPDFPDGACPSCGGLLTQGGRCPACLTFANDLRLLAFEPAVFRSRHDGGAVVSTHTASSCRPAFHLPLERLEESLARLGEHEDMGDMLLAYLSQLRSSVKEAIDACPAGDACAWGSR